MKRYSMILWQRANKKVLPYNGRTFNLRYLNSTLLIKYSGLNPGCTLRTAAVFISKPVTALATGPLKFLLAIFFGGVFNNNIIFIALYYGVKI